MAHTIQKRGFNLKPVTYCYNLIYEKAWFIPGFCRILQSKMNKKLKEKENKMSMNVLVLESVGSCVDSNGTTYPLNVDGTPDMNGGVHFDDVSIEWFDLMSDKDYEEFLEWHSEWRLSVFEIPQSKLNLYEDSI